MQGKLIGEKDRKLYLQVANKFGNRIREEIIKHSKKCSRSSLRTFTAADLSPKNQRYSSERQTVNKSIILSVDKLRTKKYDVEVFRQKLKKNLEDSRIKKQTKVHELANKVRWRRSMMIKNRKQKMEQLNETKRKQTSMMKDFLEIKKQEQQRIRTQIQMQQAFGCLERRLKTLNNPE